MKWVEHFRKNNLLGVHLAVNIFVATTLLWLILRWAEPLNENIADVVAGNLAVLLGTPNVTSGSLAYFNPTYQVTIDIQRFDSVPGKSVQIEALWVVRKSAGDAAQPGHTVASETVSGDGFDALAAALSRALAKLSGDIATVIRTEADEKPQP
jgi:uncharacterized lipoprotein YmbA